MNLDTTLKNSVARKRIFFLGLLGCLALCGTSPSAFATGSFSLNASQLQFSTRTGTTATDMLTVTNTTAFPLTITFAASGNSAFSVSELSPIVIDANGATSLSVNFSPTASGSDTGKLLLIAGTGDTGSVMLLGTATTSSLNLGFSPSGTITLNTKVGVQDTQAITITNNGSSSVTLALSAIGNSAFSVSPAMATIAAGGNATAHIMYLPTATGSTNGALLVTSGLGDTTSVALHGVANAASAITVMPAGTIVFNTKPNVADTQSVTISNTTNTPQSIVLTMSGSNLFSTRLSSLTLLGNGSTTVPIMFESNANGTSNGSLFVRSLTTGDTETIPLVGHVSFSPNLNVSTAGEVDFSANTGQMECLPISVTNNSSGAVQLTQMMVTGDTSDFHLSGSGTVMIGSGSSGAVTVCFTPTFDRGTQRGTLQFQFTGLTDTSVKGSASVMLEGTAQGRENNGDSLFFQTTRMLDFDNVIVGTSDCQVVNISNPTGSIVTIDSGYISGSGASQFMVSGASMLQAGAQSNTSLTVCYEPTVPLQENATLNLVYSGPTGSGTITIPIIANAIDTINNGGGELTNCLYVRHELGVIGPIITGGMDTSAIYLTNRSDNAITISGANVSGTNASAFSVASSQFPMTLQAGQQGQFNVGFNPTGIAGAPSYSSTVTLSLSGTGVTCQDVTIHVEGVAVPNRPIDLDTVNLQTGLSVNGTNVIAISNSSNQSCVIDTVTFTNTTNAAVTVSNIVLASNPKLTLIGTNMTFPAMVSAGGTLNAYVQYCGQGDPPGAVTTAPLYVATSQSIQPQTYQVQATQIAAAGVASDDIPSVNFSVFPNPTSDHVTIQVTSAATTNVEVFDLLGNVMETLHGMNTIDWDSHDAAGDPLPSGVYIVRVTGTDETGQPFRASKQLAIDR